MHSSTLIILALLLSHPSDTMGKKAAAKKTAAPKVVKPKPVVVPVPDRAAKSMATAALTKMQNFLKYRASDNNKSGVGKKGSH